MIFQIYRIFQSFSIFVIVTFPFVTNMSKIDTLCLVTRMIYLRFKVFQKNGIKLRMYYSLMFGPGLEDYVKIFFTFYDFMFLLAS